MKNSALSVLLSVKPDYASRLASGEKTVEFRRKFSLGLNQGTKVFIYSSSPIKCIIGECKILKVVELRIKDLLIIWNESNVNEGDFYAYFKNTEQGFAIYTYDNLKYNSPLSLSLLKKIRIVPTMSYRFLTTEQTNIVEDLVLN